MLNGKPVWTFAPNWEEGVKETLEWLTDVMPSATGAEQRRCMRLSPRRSFDASHYITGRERQMLDAALFNAGGAEWYIPLWAEVTHLSAPLATGSATLPVDPADREYRDGDYVLLIGRDAFYYEIVQVLSSTGGALQLVAPTQQDWPRGTKTYPLRVGRLQEPPTINKKTDSFVEARTVFRLTESNDAPADPGLDTYLDIPVLNARPDESEDLSHQYQRLITELDSLSGAVAYRDMAAQGITTQSYRWVMANREEYAALRRVLHLLRGRWRSLWLPTFFQDMTLSTAASLGDSELRVLVFGYTVFGGPVPGRDTIMVTLRDGTHIYAKITGSSIAGAEEVLTLDAPLAQAIDPADVLSISFMTLCRMDADSIELDHRTDAEGLTICEVTFKSVHATRTETEWAPAPLLPYDGSGVSCMPPCGPATFCAIPERAEWTTGLDYNPVTGQLWVQAQLSTDPSLIGYRINPNTMEIIDSLHVTVAGSPNFRYPSPFLFDVPNGKVYCTIVEQLPYPTSYGTQYICSFDIETGEMLQAAAQTVHVAGWGCRMWSRPADNTLWLVTSSGMGEFTNFSGVIVREISRATLLPLTSYTKTGCELYGQSPHVVVVDTNGDMFFSAYYGSSPNPNPDLNVFRTGTRTFQRSDYSDTAGEPWYLAYCKGREVIYAGNSFVNDIHEVSCATGDLTGRTIKETFMLSIYNPWIIIGSTLDNCLWYDEILDVIWSFNYYSGYDYPGGKLGCMFTGIHVETGEVYGALSGNIHPDPAPNMDYVWNSMTQLPPGAPRAFFVQGGYQVGDDADTYASGIWKIPMCHVRRGRTSEMYPPGEYGPGE